MKKHIEAAEVVLAGLEAPNAVTAEALRGLARAWDIIETTGKNLSTVPNLARQLSETLAELGVDGEASDVWDALAKELGA
jgi:hypothetical protein